HQTDHADEEEQAGSSDRRGYRPALGELHGRFGPAVLFGRGELQLTAPGIYSRGARGDAAPRINAPDMHMSRENGSSRKNAAISPASADSVSERSRSRPA